jgi:hypothetical protein
LKSLHALTIFLSSNFTASCIASSFLLAKIKFVPILLPQVFFLLIEISGLLLVKGCLVPFSASTHDKCRKHRRSLGLDATFYENFHLGIDLVP